MRSFSFYKAVSALMTFAFIFSLSHSVYADPGSNDTDNDGVVDAIDLDDDNDGITDAIESGIEPASGSPYIQDPFSVVDPGWIQVINTISPGQLMTFNTLLGGYAEVGDTYNNGFGYPSINGIGMNPVDGFIYGISNGTGQDRLGNPIIGGDLIRYDRDGEMFHVGTPSGNGWNGSGSGHFSGDIYYNTQDINDPKNGTLWVRNGSAGEMAVIDTGDATVLDTFTLTGTYASVSTDIINADGNFMTFHRAHADGSGLATITSWDASTYTLGSITTIPVTNITVSGVDPNDTGATGSGFAATDTVSGDIVPHFAFNSTGSVYKIDLTNNIASFVVQGIPTGNNDGASSPLAGIPVGDFFTDTDGDGVIDMRDLDSDNDGIADIYEAGNKKVRALDTNKNGTIDAGDVGGFEDTGSRNNSQAGNGLDDRIEQFIGQIRTGVDPVSSSLDTGFNTPDYLDLDSDGDGIPDAIEAQPTVGYIEYTNGSNDAADSDDDGILDIFEGTGATVFGTDGYQYFVDPYDHDDRDKRPDYIDVNSDKDRIHDQDEAGVTFTGVSYSDPDGMITDSASIFANMKNTDVDASDVDYRSKHVRSTYFGQNEFWCRAVGGNITDPDAFGGEAIYAQGGQGQGGTLSFGKVDADLTLGEYYMAIFRLKVSDISDTTKNILIDIHDPSTGERKAGKLLSASDFRKADKYINFKIAFKQEDNLRYEYRIFYDDGASYDLYADRVKVRSANGKMVRLYNAGEFNTNIGSYVEDINAEGEATVALEVTSANQTGGALQFGPPEEDLVNGTDYLVHFQLKVSDNTATTDQILIDAYNHANGSRELQYIKPSDFHAVDTYQTFELSFNHTAPGYEFRVFYLPGSNFTLHSETTTVYEFDDAVKYHSQAENMYSFIGEFVEDADADLGGALRVPASSTVGGTMQFGPYETNLVEGSSYTANFKLKVSDNTATDEKIYIDVFNNNIEHYEYRLLAPSDFDSANEYQTFQIPFAKATDDYEFRIFTLPSHGVDLYSDTMTVTQ